MSPATSPFLGVERSLSGRLWRSRLDDDRRGLALSQQFDLPEIVGRILAARNVSAGEVEDYLDPSLRKLLPDPSRFCDMDKASERLAAAVMSGETVGIFGDYDVDGATSAALLMRFLAAAGGQARPYIPDRIKEGYGPNLPALERLGREGIRVIVTVDCGISAFEPLEKAAAGGLEIIVVDHHLAESRLPRAFAIVNPNRLDETPGFGNLAAVGVTFLVIVAVNRTLRQKGWYRGRSEPDLRQWLDLVALGTVCDVVPLVGLNRALVLQGLKVMGRRGNTGLACLADTAGLSEPPTAYHLGYVLGPRVNAGGRVGHADLGVRLLSTNDGGEGTAISLELARYNDERRSLEARVLEEALKQVETMPDNDPVAIAVGKDWHPGVIGIVASRLKDVVRRPTLVISVANGVGKGSGRSLPGIDLGGLVTAARQAGLLENGGGHAMAAGITIREEKIPDLKAFLVSRLSDSKAVFEGAHSLGVDGALGVAGANFELVEVLERAGPFGAGNPEPRIVFPNAQIVASDIVRGGHVRCVITEGSGARLKAISFRSEQTELGQALLRRDGTRFHLAGHLRIDRWRGESRVQLSIDDVAVAN